jgi:hypothetical protein
MHATSDLAKLYHAVRRRLLRIEVLYHSLSNRPMEDRSMVLASSVIELDNTILCGLREFTVSSLRRARTLSYHRISTNRAFAAAGEISAFILSVVNPVKYQNMKSPAVVGREYEPTVRDPKDTQKVLSTCAASNISSVQNALALNFGLFRDIATIRNFYAHRNEDTAKKVRTKARSMGVPAAHHPDDLVLASPPGRPGSILQDWIGEAQIFFEELMQ